MPVVQFCNVCYWTCALWIHLGLLKLEVRLGQVLLEQCCEPLKKEEEAVGTVKSHGSDTWLSHVSSPFSLWGKNFGPRCDCFCSDLTLNSPGLTLYYPVPCSATGPSTRCAGLVGCTIGHRTTQVRKDLLAAEVTPQEEGCRWQEIQSRSGLHPWSCPTAVTNGWGNLVWCFFCPLQRKHWMISSHY